MRRPPIQRRRRGIVTSLTRALVPTIAAASVVAGCGGGGERQAPSPTVPAGEDGPSRLRESTTTCGDIIGETADGGGRLVVLSTVAIRSGYVPGSSPLTPSGEPDHRFFAKDGLLVRSNASQTASIEVPAAWRDRIAIGWGSPARPSAIVRVARCESASPWVAYSGGFFVNEPVCAPIIVRVDDRRQVVRVGVGVRCGRSSA